MKNVIALVISSLALIAGSIWAFTSGARYELRDYAPSERVSLLDTTMIGEKWMLIGGGMAFLAATALILAVALYFRARRRALA